MDDKTKIPMGWMFALIGALATAFFFASGVIVWGAHTEDKVNTTAEKVAKIEVVQSTYDSNQQDIKQALARIEGYLKKGGFGP